MSQDLCITFLWNIENFIFCTLEEGFCLRSSAFYVENLSRSEWHLGLYSNNRETRVFLHNRNFHDSDLFIDYDIDYLHEDGSLLWEAGGEKNMQIDSGTSYDAAAIPLKEKLWGNRSKQLLFTDTLTIRCRIWPSKKVLKRSVKYVSRTVIGIERRVFYWDVQEFSQLELCGERRTRRIITGSDKPTFSLELFLEGADADQANVCIDIKQLNESLSKLFSFCKISVLDAEGSTLRSFSDFKNFKYNDSVWNFEWALTKTEVMANQQKYLDGDVLNLLFAITFNTGETNSYTESVTTLPSWVHTPIETDVGISFNDAQDSDIDLSSNDPRCYVSDASLSGVQDSDGSESSGEIPAILQESFFYLYNDRSSSDFELRSDTIPFPIHKNVLAARSSVFNAMFANMKEAVNFIDIPDVDAITLAMLLEFIYTGNVEGLDLSNAPDLYFAADKYQVHPLKRKCHEFLEAQTDC